MNGKRSFYLLLWCLLPALPLSAQWLQRGGIGNHLDITGVHTAYVMTTVQVGSHSYRHSLYRSEDCLWSNSLVYEYFNGTMGCCFADQFIEFPTPDRGYYVFNDAGNRVLMTSNDGGQSWSPSAQAYLLSLYADHHAPNDSDLYVLGWFTDHPTTPNMLYHNRAPGYGDIFLTANYDFFGGKVEFPSPSRGYILCRDAVDNWVIIASQDSGQNWMPVYTSPDSLYELTFPHPDTGYVGAGNGLLLRTYDGGATWDSLSTPAPGPVTALWFPRPDSGYIGSDAGYIAHTATYGDSFLPDSFPNPVRLLRIEFTDSGAGLVMDANRIFYVNYTCLSVERSEPELPEITVWPQPADGLLQVQAPGAWDFALLDLQGRVMARGGIRESARLATDGLPQGVYFLRLQQGDTHVVKKVSIRR